MKVYVVRHGQTDWNFERKIQGKTDIELNNTGKEQAEQIGEKIKDYNIDLIISSPLKRAKATANIINKKIKCDIITDKALEERGLGIFEGKTVESVKDKVFDSQILDNYYSNEQYGEVEPVQQLCNRVWNLLDKLKEEYKDKNILLVTHGGTSRAINAYFEGVNDNGIIEKVKIDNCGIKEYEL